MALISFHAAGVGFTIRNKKRIRELINSISVIERLKFHEISIIFCSDQYLLNLNQTYLNHNYFTDIITFQLNTSSEPISGELFISIDRVRENATNFDVAYNQEMLRVIIHGVLHLCGYQDKTAGHKRTMRLREDYYLALFRST